MADFDIKEEREIEIPQFLPILPVRDVVIFPYMILPLFVGRDISIKAIEERWETAGTKRSKALSNFFNSRQTHRCQDLSFFTACPGAKIRLNELATTCSLNTRFPNTALMDSISFFVRKCS